MSNYSKWQFGAEMFGVGVGVLGCGFFTLCSFYDDSAQISASYILKQRTLMGCFLYKHALLN